MLFCPLPPLLLLFRAQTPQDQFINCLLLMLSFPFLLLRRARSPTPACWELVGCWQPQGDTAPCLEGGDADTAHTSSSSLQRIGARDLPVPSYAEHVSVWGSIPALKEGRKNHSSYAVGSSISCVAKYSLF